ncbi:hypothetical protein B0E53_05799 [Micromonospora sp. MH33]|nr:hypothetical protein B0E53_05799 [Micromonospora sp. MH33]
MAGLACRKSANCPCGSTTQLVNCSYGSPTASSTACSISAGVPATTSPRSSGLSPVSSLVTSNPGGMSWRPALAVFTVPRPSRRTTRVATYRSPADSKTSRTRASVADGARALASPRVPPQRGTVP